MRVCVCVCIERKRKAPLHYFLLTLSLFCSDRVLSQKQYIFGNNQSMEEERYWNSNYFLYFIPTFLSYIWFQNFQQNPKYFISNGIFALSKNVKRPWNLEGVYGTLFKWASPTQIIWIGHFFGTPEILKPRENLPGKHLG